MTSAIFLMSELTTKVRVPVGQVSSSYNLLLKNVPCKIECKNTPCKIGLNKNTYRPICFIDFVGICRKLECARDFQNNYF